MGDASPLVPLRTDLRTDLRKDGSRLPERRRRLRVPWSRGLRPAPPVSRLLLLAALLHGLVLVWVGSAPPGSAKLGEGRWGALNVVLRGPVGAGPAEAVGRLPEAYSGPRGRAEPLRWGGAVRDALPQPMPATPGAAQIGTWRATDGGRNAGGDEPAPAAADLRAADGPAPTSTPATTPAIPSATTPATTPATTTATTPATTPPPTSPAALAEPRLLRSPVAVPVPELVPLQPLSPLTPPAPRAQRSLDRGADPGDWTRPAGVAPLALLPRPPAVAEAPAAPITFQPIARPPAPALQRTAPGLPAPLEPASALAFALPAVAAAPAPPSPPSPPVQLAPAVEPPPAPIAAQSPPPRALAPPITAASLPAMEPAKAAAVPLPAVAVAVAVAPAVPVAAAAVSTAPVAAAPAPAAPVAAGAAQPSILRDAVPASTGNAGASRPPGAVTNANDNPAQTGGSLLTGGAPDSGARLGHDVASLPSAASSAPRLNLELSRPHGGELSAQGSRGVLQLLARPPETRSKLEKDIAKAAKPDCKQAYAGMGLLAVLPLAVDAVRDKGCRW